MNTLKRLDALRGACHKALNIMPTSQQSEFDQKAINTLIVVERELYLIKVELKSTIKETDLVESG